LEPEVVLERGCGGGTPPAVRYSTNYFIPVGRLFSQFAKYELDRKEKNYNI
jgi:hypothetical protein